MKQVSDVIVVGAGVIGLLTARELRSHGLSVTILERGRVGMEASRAGGGILSPIPPWEGPAAVDALAHHSRGLFAPLADALLASTGVDIEYLSSGVLLLDESPTPASQNWAAACDQVVENLDATALRELEPQLQSRWEQGLYLPGLAQLRNPRFTHALHQDLLSAGVTLMQQTPVTQWLIDAERITGVRTPAGDLSSNRVVVATGAWTTTLLGELSVAEIQPVRGQMLWYQLAPGIFNRILIADDEYLIPRRDGVCLVGSTVEQVGFDDGTTGEAREKLAAVARRFSDVFDEIPPSGQWSGLRPGKLDGVPVISRHPVIKGLFINAGHFRNGINLAPASAQLMASLVLGRQPGLDPGPYCAEDRLYSGYD